MQKGKRSNPVATKKFNEASFIASFSLALMLAFFVCGSLVFRSLSIPLPNEMSPVLFYSSDEYSLRHVVLKLLNRAKKTLYLSTYALTDEAILSTLMSRQIPNVNILTDHKTLPRAFRPFSETLPWELRKTRGLMHEKILLIDDEEAYLGSANMTYESLKMHSNLIVGIYNSAFTKELSKNEFGIKRFQLDQMLVTFCRLPCKNEDPIRLIKEMIDEAKHQIKIAMFTLTHPMLLNALESAKTRGVDVEIYLDRTSSRGASKRAVTQLKGCGIHVFANVGAELLHHKMMLVDEESFVIGSANWTKSAFVKNQDFFLTMSPMSDKNKKTLCRIFHKIKRNSKLLD